MDKILGKIKMICFINKAFRKKTFNLYSKFE